MRKRHRKLRDTRHERLRCRADACVMHDGATMVEEIFKSNVADVKHVWRCADFRRDPTHKQRANAQRFANTDSQVLKVGHVEIGGAVCPHNRSIACINPCL